MPSRSAVPNACRPQRDLIKMMSIARIAFMTVSPLRWMRWTEIRDAEDLEPYIRRVKTNHRVASAALVDERNAPVIGIDNLPVIARLMFGEQRIEIHVKDPRVIIDRIMGPWNWWRRGLLIKYTKNQDSSVETDLQAITKPIPAPLHLKLQPPEQIANGWHISAYFSTVVDGKTNGVFEGPGSFDVELARDAEGRDGYQLVHKFNGVKPHGAPASIGVNLHFAATGGSLRWPFPHGTGFPGLAYDLEHGR